MNPQAKKRGGFMFNKMGRPPGGAAVNKPGMKRGKKAFFAEGGTTLAERERMYMDPTKLEDEDKAKDAAPKAKELSQADIDRMSYGEAFRHFRKQGAGTKFTWRGNKQAAYRAEEAPAAFRKKDEAPKAKAEEPSEPYKQSTGPIRRYSAKAEPYKQSTGPLRRYSAKNKEEPSEPYKQSTGPLRRYSAKNKEEPSEPYKQSTGPLRRYSAKNKGYTSAGAFSSVKDLRPSMEMSEDSYQDRNPALQKALNRSMPEYKLNFAKGGSVESKSMMKKEVAFMKAKGAPKSMVKHEEAEAKGMKRGGMACGGMKKYARGGGIESHGKTKGTMIKMASGGSVSARADGVAQRGKTNCKIC